MNKNNDKYGLLTYSSYNIGDEIQSVAASRFLPKVDYWINRERIDKNIDKCKLIMNAWWMWQSEHFPPNNSITPLLISMHWRSALQNKPLNNNIKQYLIENGPVGCRDVYTMKYFQKNNIPVYFSGCLTLTLEKNPNIKRQDYILAVNVPQNVLEKIKSKTNRKVYSLNKFLMPILGNKKRFEFSKLYLYLLHSAHYVITGNLHTALPCVAFETPVLLLYGEEHDRITNRLSGMENFLNHFGARDFIDDKKNFDFENPPPPTTKYIQIKDELIKKCFNFTNYNNTNSIIADSINPFDELMNMIWLINYRKPMQDRVLHYASPHELFDTWWQKVIKKKDRHDLPVI